MDKPVPIKENVYWIGINDRETHLFESLWPLPKGVSYNAYMIVDEKVALIDTVKFTVTSSYLDKIKKLMGDGKKIDYLVINHMEPDHSGSIQAIIDHYPDIKLVGNKKTARFLENFYEITENIQVVTLAAVLLTLAATAAVMTERASAADAATRRRLSAAPTLPSPGP